MLNSFLELAARVFELTDRPLTYQEAWELAKEKGLTQKLATKGKTPWQSFGARLYVDTRDNPNSVFIKVGSRPIRFFLKRREGEISANLIQTLDKKAEKAVPASTAYRERDLHPVLAYFASASPAFNRGRSIFTKTIHHENSSKAGVSEWTYPDMVGFYLPIGDWRPDVIEFNRLSDNNSLKLFSFEIKKSISRSNYRESFFQAVSNSSWAHEAYLVTADITEDDALLAELERLASSFGVGIIRLELSDIDSSAVVYPARTRENLDWETINKLCQQNPDFEKFLQDVRIDFEARRIHRSEYDQVQADIDEYIQKQLKITSRP